MFFCTGFNDRHNARISDICEFYCTRADCGDGLFSASVNGGADFFQTVDKLRFHLVFTRVTWLSSCSFSGMFCHCIIIKYKNYITIIYKWLLVVKKEQESVRMGDVIKKRNCQILAKKHLQNVKKAHEDVET